MNLPRNTHPLVDQSQLDKRQEHSGDRRAEIAESSTPRIWKRPLPGDLNEFGICEECDTNYSACVGLYQCPFCSEGT